MSHAPASCKLVGHQSWHLHLNRSKLVVTIPSVATGCWGVQVRNTANGIVQFEYGDDGRDPVAMEGDSGQPLDFERMLSHLRATTRPDPAGQPSEDPSRHA